MLFEQLQQPLRIQTCARPEFPRHLIILGQALHQPTAERFALSRRTHPRRSAVADNQQAQNVAATGLALAFTFGLRQPGRHPSRVQALHQQQRAEQDFGEGFSVAHGQAPD
ncbi:hypothetical protein D3C86_1901480 [compost metagenome]